MYRDILVPLVTVPESSEDATLDRLLGTASILHGAVTALAVEVDFVQPTYMYADAVVFMYDAFLDVEQANDARVERLVAAFERHAIASAVSSDTEIVRAFSGDVPSVLARRARLHDLTVFILEEGDVYMRQCVEGVVFGSGKPVLVLPPGGALRAPKNVIVAWDFSRECARALTDAMPVLRKAESVTLVHAAKDGATLHPAAASVRRHLGRAGIDGQFLQVSTGALSAYQTIEEYARHHDADLIVMGAYGHNRLREFVLGGVTRDTLKAPSLPVLMSH